MYSYYSLLLFFLPLLLLGAAAPPQRCTKLFVSYDEGYEGNSSYFNATLSLFKEDSANSTKTRILVSNPQYYQSYQQNRPYGYCINYDSMKCSPLLIPTNLTTQFPKISLDLESSEFGGTFNDVYFGFIDDGTFSRPDGTFFTPENPSYDEAHPNRHGGFWYAQNCLAFAPAPVAPPAPKCLVFKSTTVIMNATDHYSTYATSSMTYNLTERTFIGDGEAQVPPNYFWRYGLNVGNEYCSTEYGLRCTFNIRPKGVTDQKLIMYAEVGKKTGTTQQISADIPMVAKVILREDQTLMREGTPFTKENNCDYYNSPFSDTLVATNKFCCLLFDEN